MQPGEDRNTHFLAWMAAESAAYMAIHTLHQRSHGGRKAFALSDIEQIRRLRKEAEARFAALQLDLGGVPTPAAVAPAVVPIAPARARKEPVRGVFAVPRAAAGTPSSSSRAN
ncbi:hypothetical protein M2165_000326 [Variovorax sp. TBS-050B]|nr:hypothetical protein [Variovorax sp. TBS-050B]